MFGRLFKPVFLSNAIAAIFGRFTFQAPLVNSLILYRGTGDPTFTRADGADRRATVVDFEGRVIAVKAGEARFTGARRVENLLTYSEDTSNAAWAATNVTKASTDTLTASAANGTVLQSYTATAGDYVFSVDLKRKTGTGTIQIAADSGTYTTVTLSNDWQRFSVGQTVAAGAKTAGIKIVTDTDAVYFRKAQLQNKTGASDPTVPDDYVSSNVLSAPYHGAGVDSVKYFVTANGNTVV